MREHHPDRLAASGVPAEFRVAADRRLAAINAAYETTLRQGVLLERRLFHSMFATADQKEGMSAFTEKRPPKFENR